MKRIQSVARSGAILALACALAVPSIVLAQTFGPPPGYENMMPPNGMPTGAPYSMPEGDDSKNVGPNGMQFGQSGVPNGQQNGAPSGMQGAGKGMAEKGLKMLKKGVSNMKKATGQMDKTIEKLTKAGYSAPAEVVDSLAKAKAAIATIEGTSTMTEEAMNAMSDFNDFIDVLDANIQELNMLANFPRILKQAESNLTKLGKNFDSVKAKLVKNGVDAGTSIAEVQTKIDALKATLEKAKQSAVSGKAEDAFTSLQDDFFPNLEDAFQSAGMLDAINSLTKGAVRSIEKGIAQAQKTADKVKNQGKDVSEAMGIIADSKTKLEELKTLLKSKDFTPDDAVSILEDLDGLRADFETSIEDVTGKPLEGNSSIKFTNMKAPLAPKEIRGEFPQGGDSGFQKMNYGF
ncbi:MAG: hypothetical protein NTX63_03710 [Candidatus Peregrinibacteria bacterium]|nr:hypothetical protein [Candidatus Peregrinibacteria bacterium]